MPCRARPGEGRSHQWRAAPGSPPRSEGSAAPRPLERSGWLKRALQDYRVLLLDQRGTGLSTPVLPQTLAHFPCAAAQADYLAHFRADSIVRDAELIRRQLVGELPWPYHPV